MECLLHYLEENKWEETGEAVLPIFKLEGGFDWKRVYSLIKRERRRLQEGLPIYAFRQDILQAIHFQQVIYGEPIFNRFWFLHASKF